MNVKDVQIFIRYIDLFFINHYTLKYMIPKIINEIEFTKWLNKYC